MARTKLRGLPIYLARVPGNQVKIVLPQNPPKQNRFLKSLKEKDPLKLERSLLQQLLQ